MQETMASTTAAPRRPRAVTLRLEEEFLASNRQCPSEHRVFQLATELGDEPIKLRQWFMRRRQRERKFVADTLFASPCPKVDTTKPPPCTPQHLQAFPATASPFLSPPAHNNTATAATTPSRSRACLVHASTTHHVKKVALSQDGTRLFCTHDDRVVVWNTATNALEHSIALADAYDVDALVISADNSRVFMLQHEGELRVLTIAPSSDGKSFAYDVVDVGSHVTLLPAPCVVLSPDNQHLFYGGYERVEVLHVGSTTPGHSHVTLKQTLKWFDFPQQTTPTEDMLFPDQDDDDDDCMSTDTSLAWCEQKRVAFDRWFSHAQALCCLCVSQPDGRVLFSGHNDGRVRAWNAQTFARYTFPAHAGRVIGLHSPTKDTLFSANEHEVKCWTVSDTTCNFVVPVSGGIRDLHFTNTCAVFATLRKPGLWVLEFNNPAGTKARLLTGTTEDNNGHWDDVAIAATDSRVLVTASCIMGVIGWTVDQAVQPPAATEPSKSKPAAQRSKKALQPKPTAATQATEDHTSKRNLPKRALQFDDPDLVSSLENQLDSMNVSAEARAAIATLVDRQKTSKPKSRVNPSNVVA